MTMGRSAAFLLLAAAAALGPSVAAETYDPALLHELRYRMIGPHRGGRTKAAAGIPERPSVFYVGAVNGGVWKTDDYGRTWVPLFDDQPTGSIGALAIAPSNPDVIYAGSGEGLQRPDLSTGDGIYKSVDGGKTWRHLGLREGRQIPQILVDPRDPDRLFVAVLGSPYGAGPERGIFRSTDGGATFEKVLYRDEDTGGVDLAFDPTDARTVYAVLWESRQAPWENGEFSGPGSGVYKSTDGGSTWRPIVKGLPTFAEDGLGRIGITVAPSSPRRLFATVEAKKKAGLYRSDDAGESWSLVNADTRVTEREDDFAEVKVDPRNPDVVYTASVVVWKSTDGGRTFTAFRGAPGGDDYHRIWINPLHPEVMLVAADQGVIITVNGGQSWSSWYNQPTAQFYHVSTDNAFPYRVCGGQQESGSVCIQSRGDDGQITFREWHPVGAEEYGYIAPDPLDPDVVYGGKLNRYDRRTNQSQTIAPRPVRPAEGYRVVRTEPVLFSPTDPHTLFFASNVVWKTTDGGRAWTAISPDLTRKTWTAPANVGKYRDSDAARPTQRGVVYTLAPSPLDGKRIWAGTDDGLVHVTTDGGAQWTDVTPPALRDRPWSKVSLIEASHFDAGTAYAAINTIRLDDLRPHVYRTRDLGRTWTEIVAGLPDGGVVNAVREDPVRRGLLFAGTEQAVYVSFDDGERWQSLRLNMPATSVRDLVVKDDDLVVGTHGRSFWILDDITPLRQLAPAIAQEAAALFAPAEAWRFRWNTNTDTPLPPDEPAGQNPPDGAILDYALAADARHVSLEILDASGALVRRYQSDDVPEPPVEGRNIPDYWIRPPQVLSARAGLHRFVWDLHYAPPAAAEFSYPIAAVPHDTPREPRGPWALPGAYTVRLTADGHVVTRPLRIKMDPRVRTSAADLRAQFDSSVEVARDLARIREALDRVKAQAGRTDALTALDTKLVTLYTILQEADAAPTAAALETAVALRRETAQAVAAVPRPPS
jgi:photosystem II stability/assembly factor-like uncharacterized protein